MPEGRYSARRMSSERRAMAGVLTLGGPGREGAIAVMIALCVGCGAAASRRASPDPAVRAYGEALAARSPERTLELELATAHRGRDAAAQRAAIEEAGEELAGLGATISTIDPGRIQAHARIPLTDGGIVVLARESDGSWRIEGGPIGAP